MDNELLLQRIAAGEEVFWINSGLDNNLSDKVLERDVCEASERLTRFAPFLQRAFGLKSGIIESPLQQIPKMQQDLVSTGARGQLFVKLDSHLPISGSVKARGGIYEVLCFAEKVAIGSGMLLPSDDYSVLFSERFRRLFEGYSLAVGSTGNLGLSIGIMGRKLGFEVAVHMSSDAAEWKKVALRAAGAEVIEYAGDYEKAVREGRRLAELDPKCHFVDDENSMTLFLGYAVAGMRLAKQLQEAGIVCDQKTPLYVYLPCGVGGAPGGITYGIKQIFGANAHCFFVEPTQAPCMLLGVSTGKKERISALDIGLNGKTIADGLAVTRPSRLVCDLVKGLIDGFFTVSDQRLLDYVKRLHLKERIFVEPSAAAGFFGYQRLMANNEKKPLSQEHQRLLSKGSDATHIIWTTGGSMVPEQLQAELTAQK